MTTMTTRVVRIEVRPTQGAGDPRADALVRQAPHVGVTLARASTARVYLVRGDLTDDQAQRLASALLADPVGETYMLGATPVASDVRTIEVHPLPGVMDPPALTVEKAARELLGIADGDGFEVITGLRYDLPGISASDAHTLATKLLANDAVEQVHHEPWHPDDFPHAPPADQTLTHVTITSLDDAQLEALSRDGHLFLSLDEMRAIRGFYREAGREPTDIELETLAQTWSEHCVHKTLKSTVTYTPHAGEDVIDWSAIPNTEVHEDGSVTIHNLLKSTVAAATHELIAGGVDWTLSVFVDNAGIIRFDEHHAVCVKVETHNHPSAIEPYGGAATGIGGCIRDIIGTGLGARPIANTDVFCVATPDIDHVPEGCLHPRRVLTRVVDGVRDYGNRMGIPTVNGAVHFDDRYVGNPLVFAGCVGVMPNHLTHGEAQPGDRIIALGGRTGRDGIHGATFSSAELTDTHADEFSHAVQIGNAIEEKRVLDAVLRARDYTPDEGTRHEASGTSGEGAEGSPGAQCLVPSACLYNAITDCGAGGFSSAVGEMGERLGAEVHLEHAPLKYAGLRYDEIWISESQERMVLAVPEANVAALQRICDEEGVEMADLGHFGTPERDLVLRYEGREMGRLPMAFLHDGLPMPMREATWTAPEVKAVERTTSDVRTRLLDQLADPNTASKRWIVRQYDHEVQGNTVIKPLIGANGDGPGDAAVIQPVPGSERGLAIACGLNISTGDPYERALAGIDECVRNLVCVGADPSRIAILDNFCWPSCQKPENLGALVRACAGCYDGAKAYRTPFVSGKDSLNNQFRTKTGDVIEIPYTLLITGIGVVEDVSTCVTMDAKRAGNVIVAFGAPEPTCDAAHLDRNVRAAHEVHALIEKGLVTSAHDASEGGEIVALAEILIAGADAIGATITEPQRAWFGEGNARYLLEMTEDQWARFLAEHADDVDSAYAPVATLTDDATLTIGDERIPVSDCRTAFYGTLDW
ncbi:MAG: phosphoribosylformylglycinamidine synthase subunit PurL [Phycisphaerales bacterium]